MITQQEPLRVHVARAVGVPTLLRATRQNWPILVGYHGVCRDEEWRDWDTSDLVAESTFRRHLELYRRHYHVVPLKHMADVLAGRRHDLPPRALAITFDDGYRDNVTNAAPVLQRLGLPATFFIVTGRMGGVMVPDEDPATGAIMTWEEVRELVRAGFDIGGHTVTHPHLARLGEEEQRREILDCARAIAEQLGQRPEAFAYPYGSVADYNEVSVRLVREAGFQYAVSNRYGANPPGCDRWTLRRIWIDGTDSLETFQAKVAGRLDAFALLDSPAGIALRRGLNRALGIR